MDMLPPRQETDYCHQQTVHSRVYTCLVRHHPMIQKRRFRDVEIALNSMEMSGTYRAKAQEYLINNICS